VHSSQTTRVREDVTEPVQAIEAPNVSLQKSPDLQFYPDNTKHKVWEGRTDACGTQAQFQRATKERSHATILTQLQFSFQCPSGIFS